MGVVDGLDAVCKGLRLGRRLEAAPKQSAVGVQRELVHGVDGGQVRKYKVQRRRAAGGGAVPRSCCLELVRCRLGNREARGDSLPRRLGRILQHDGGAGDRVWLAKLRQPRAWCHPSLVPPFSAKLTNHYLKPTK